MFIGKHIARILLGGLALFAASCSTGEGSGAPATVNGAVQNLTLDPAGLTTVLTFSQAFPGIAPANLQASGGQTAQTVTPSGNSITVTWDERVTPSHQVRVNGVAGLSSAWRSVTTTNSGTPTFTIESAIQTPGLGGDEIELSFSGPPVAPETAEDPASWELEVAGNVLDLAGSTFTFDIGTQSLVVVLGPLANLHASFELTAVGVTSVADVPASAVAVVGNANGDVTAPSLLTAEQNLAEDEYGRVVDFTFDEAMDPVIAQGLGRYTAPAPNAAVSVEQPSDEVLRVTFASPVIPGVHQITLNGLSDSHGNALPGGPTAIAQPSPVANAFDGNPQAVTVSGAGGDYVVVVTEQAFDVESAEDPANWSLIVDGNPVVLADQVLTYDFLARTLTIEIDFDMQNGTAFSIEALGVLEVDGQNYADDFAGVVAGDAVEPEVASAVQNRNFDPTGRTLQLTLSEAVQQASAQNTGNYTLSDNGIGVVSASLLPNGTVVRLTLDEVAVPGIVTLTVDNLVDLAGNAMSAPQVGIVLTSTDSTAPGIVLATARANEGANDDMIVVTFNDDMVADDVEDPAKWSFESPIGTAFDVSACTIGYDAGNRRAILTLDAGGLDLQRDSDFQVVLSGMRDIAGNSILAGEFEGDVEFENTRPTLVGAWRDAAQTNQVVLRFSEPCAFTNDLYDALTNPTGTRYTLWDGVVERGRPSSATTLDEGLGVRLTFGFLVNLTDTLDVYGLADLAGNMMFPQLQVPLEAEDPTVPSFDVGFSTLTAVSGEANDEITFVFDVPMSPWRLLDPSNYTLSTGGNPISLEDAEFSFDGLRTVSVLLGRAAEIDLQASELYDIGVQDVRSAQGVVRVVPFDEPNLPVGGDAVPPQVGLSDVRLDPLDPNSLLVFASEALDELSASDPGAYDYDNGTLATEATLLSPRVVRVTFPGPVSAGPQLDLTLTDRAGNASGVITRVVAAADVQAPLLAGVAGIATPGFGGDLLRVSFDESVDPDSALSVSNYTVTNGGQPVDLLGAVTRWESSTLTVVFELASGVSLDPSQPINFTVRNVADWSGNAISAAGVSLGGAVTGDTTAPGISAAFVNWRADEQGQVVDVLFSEEVQGAFVGNAGNWTAGGGAATLDVQVLERDAVRIFLSAPLGGGQSLTLAGGLSDPAGNTAGVLVFTPER